MTKQITVTIIETREKDITIEAVTLDEAVDTIEYLYSEGNFVLTNDNISNVDFAGYEEE